MTEPTKADVDRVLRQMEREPDVRRLPPLESMEFSAEEKARLRVYCAQMTRYRLRRWWRRWLT